MKKIYIVLVALLFWLFAKPALAQYNGISIPTESITPSPSPAPKMINYELPYPGILPGNPIYSIKVLRDKVVEIMTTDPSRRTSFYLLQADKRLAASIILFNSGNPTLGEHTLSKSQNYLEMSIDEAIKAKKIQKNVNDTIAKIKASSQKEKDEINELLPKTKGEISDKLKTDLKRAEAIEKDAEALD